eukprot:UN25490
MSNRLFEEFYNLFLFVEFSRVFLPIKPLLPNIVLSTFYIIVADQTSNGLTFKSCV